MNLIYLIIIIIVFLITLLFIITRFTPKATVVTAGTFSKKRTNYLKQISPLIDVNLNKYFFKKPFLGIADGPCMIPKGINDKDLFAAEYMDENNIELNSGDILVIKFIDKNSKEVIKLREFDSFTNALEESLIVKRYREDGILKKPFSEHTTKDIFAKVLLVHKGYGKWKKIFS